MFNKKAVISVIIVVLLIVSFLARGVIVPFILGAIFAYIFNPLIKFVHKNTGISRFWAIIIFFILLTGLLAFLSGLIVSQVIHESKQITKEISTISSFGAASLKNLPEWNFFGQTFSSQTLVVNSLRGFTVAIGRFQNSLLPFFTGALGFLVKFLIFVISSFYFLKDGQDIIEQLLGKVPENYQPAYREIVHKINNVLGGYLRGQLLLILIMGTATSFVLTLLGVKYAIVLGLASGFLELVPFVGPVIAGGLATIVALIEGTNYFGLDATSTAILVVVIYFAFRQIEDYFVNPWILGRLTRLHPLLVIFSTLAGGAIAGPVGFILGVPVAACGRVLLEWSLEKSK